VEEVAPLDLAVLVEQQTKVLMVAAVVVAVIGLQVEAVVQAVVEVLVTQDKMVAAVAMVLLLL
jgi:hypothetical protein